MKEESRKAYLWLNDDLRAKIEEFVKALNEKFGDPNLSYYATYGIKRAKVVMKSYTHESVYGFIEKDGKVFKAADWSTPAKHARGDIYGENILEGMERYSPKYLVK